VRPAGLSRDLAVTPLRFVLSTNTNLNRVGQEAAAIVVRRPNLGHFHMAEATPTYDLMVLLSTSAEEDRRAKILADVEAAISRGGGSIVHNGDWGTRPMSFRIQHESEAEYHLLQFTGPTTLLETLRHSLGITDGVLRSRIIKVLPGTPPPPTPTPVAVHAHATPPAAQAAAAEAAAEPAEPEAAAEPGEAAAPSQPAAPIESAEAAESAGPDEPEAPAAPAE
jgi:small subunit ribosomal protein S6